MGVIIGITVRNRVATVPQKIAYVCGNSDFMVDFDFDEEWDRHTTKTARFVYNGNYTDVVFQGNLCAIPVISKTINIKVGVFAGDLHTTTPATIMAKKSILCDSGLPADPTPDVYAQIMELLSNLGGGVDPEAVENAVKDYMEQNPMAEKDPTVPEWAKKPTKPEYTAQEVGALPSTYTPPEQTAEQVGADPKGTAEAVVLEHNTADDSHGDIRLALKAVNDRLTAFFDSDDQTLDELSEIVDFITSNKTLIDSITTSKVSVSDIVNNLTTNVTNKPLSAAQGVALKVLIDAITVPTKLSQLTNDKGFITDYTETDPTVPAWAKAASKPSYSKSEVGLGNVDNVKQYSASNPPPYPVTSVNGEVGAVKLDADAVGARPSTWMPTHTDVGAEKSGMAATAVGSHNVNTDAHNDIRLLIAALANRLDALANSDDNTLDQMAEVVAYIKDNRNLIEQITTGKVSVADIVNNLTTNVSNKPLSAAQGVALKALIDAITIPTKLSQLTNDKGYITGYTETDPTVPAWAKASSKPSYSKSEVGLGNVDNVKQYSASNPPPYPVTSVNGETGAVTLDASAVGARPDTWTPTAANVGAVPTSRTVNGKTLSSNITLAASDVGAVPTTQTITVTGVDADGVSHSWTMYGVAQ